MLRDYRMGQRLSGATISDYCSRTGDYPRTISDYCPECRDYSATIERLFQPIQRLFRDYWKHAARISGRRFFSETSLNGGCPLVPLALSPPGLPPSGRDRTAPVVRRSVVRRRVAHPLTLSPSRPDPLDVLRLPRVVVPSRRLSRACSLPPCLMCSRAPLAAPAVSCELVLRYKCGSNAL